MISTEAPRSEKEKDAAIAAGIASIEKAYGEGAIFNMSSRVGRPMPHVPTGVWELDNDVLGIGGVPRGRIVEIIGPESGGKTTLALRLLAEAQLRGYRCAFIDAEHAFDPNWATKIGVNVNKLLVSQPDCGEQALDIAEALIETQALGVIIIDSVAALVPRAELDGDMGDASVGLQARLMSQAMRKLTAKVNRSGTVLVFINQIREKIGVSFGSPETTPGGRALKFYASVRLDVRRIGSVKEGEQITGNRVRVRAVKNKVAPPFREVELDLFFDRGFDGLASMLNAAIEKQVITKSGSWYSFGDVKLGHGIANVLDAVAKDNTLCDSIENKLLVEMKGQQTSGEQSSQL